MPIGNLFHVTDTLIRLLDLNVKRLVSGGPVNTVSRPPESLTGQTRALNLFLRRGAWNAAVDVLSSGAEIVHDGPILLFALQGAADVDGVALGEGDAVIAQGRVTADTEGFLYAARLSRG